MNIRITMNNTAGEIDSRTVEVNTAAPEVGNFCPIKDALLEMLREAAYLTPGDSFHISEEA